MDILVVGKEQNFRELDQRLGDKHRLVYQSSRAEAAADVAAVTVVFDFLPVDTPAEVDLYRDSRVHLLLNTALITLRDLLYNNDLVQRGRVYGFNGLDGFTSHGCLELVAIGDSKKQLGDLLSGEDIDYAFVDDRVGMVTPRIICMIINEAFNTVQEGTASRADIDMAMKLGTNYPFGPFEWCERLGIKTVYELLSALYHDTRDERFKISPLLKKEYLDSRINTI